jgi:hypothetical protein
MGFVVGENMGLRLETQAESEFEWLLQAYLDVYPLPSEFEKWKNELAVGILCERDGGKGCQCVKIPDK